jgi:hypothetical protein
VHQGQDLIQLPEGRRQMQQHCQQQQGAKKAVHGRSLVGSGALCRLCCHDCRSVDVSCVCLPAGLV